MTNKLRLGITFLLAVTVLESTAQQDNGRPNVLFIAVDDLLPALGCYGNKEVHSPHIDALATQSALFTKNYVTVPTCGASRYSLLRSALPSSRAELGNEIANRFSNPNVKDLRGPETFIEQFRNNGYHTVGIGKISHAADGYVYPYAAPKSERQELPRSWDEMLFDAGKWGQAWNAFFGYADGENRTSKQGNVPPYEAGEVDDEGYVDGLTAALAIDKLNELSRQDKPFFLGVGFFKPHLPFNAPKKYWDLYDEDELPLSITPNIPQDVHRASLHNSSEFNSYKGGAEKAALDQALSDEYSRKLIHGYYACVSYVDAQIGKVLQTLEETGLARNTIVVLWSDHGWHLGDYNVWGKHTLFDRSLRSVLIMRTPDMREGKEIDRVVSAIDIAPTLLELCQVAPLPEADGHSMVRLLDNVQDKSWTDVAYSYYRNGITMMTPRYRLTRYFRKEQPVLELYDHKNDPLETRNVADENPSIIRKLNPLWEQGNTGLYD